MARNPWPAAWATGSRPHIEEYDLATGETFDTGAPVVLDGSEEVTECGADPTSVLGLAADPAEHVIVPGKVRVTVAEQDTLFFWYCTTDPTAANLDQPYGIVKSNGIWLIDLTETTTDVVRIVRIVEQGENVLALARFIQSVRQLG